MDARPGIAGIEYPVRPMLAVTAPRRPTSHPGRWAAEPKLDGFRCITRRSEHRVALQSRQQRSLTRYFPEIVAAVAELDVEVVLDGEVVLWREGRIDFAALQRRLHPVEGVVAKRLDHTYRPTNGRTWSKIRTRLTAEAIVGGVIGSLEQPEALILGRHDHRGRLRVAGRTTPLLPAARTEIAAVLTPAAGGHPWPPAIPSSRFGTAAQRAHRVSAGRADRRRRARRRHGVRELPVAPRRAVRPRPPRPPASRRPF